MVPEFRYLIHGLVLASEVELPLPVAATRPADVTYRVSLGAPSQAPIYSRADDPDDPWAVEHWIGGRLAVEFPRWATFELGRDDVALVADDTGDPDLVAHLLLDHVVPRVVALRGDLMLHGAGAVGPSGHAHVFLGKTGAGKSTIVAGLVSSEWELLDDDGIRVVETDHEMVAVPGAPSIRLLPEAADVLRAARPGQRVASGHAKRRFSAESFGFRVARAPARVAGVYLLARSNVSKPRVERLGLALALSAIVEHGFHLADEPAAITRQAFERATALAAAAPIWRLLHPKGLDRLTETFTLITELDDGLAAR